MWSLSNIIANSKRSSIHHEFSFETSVNENGGVKRTARWLIAGHIFLRKSLHSQHDQLQDLALVETLFKEYGTDFIHYLTGQFVIIHIEPNKFTIYSDHFAIRKFFIWQKKHEFIISDDLKTITQSVHPAISKTSIANYAIDYHFTGGTTAFENVRHNEPGQVIDFKDGRLTFSNYWQPADLLKIEKRKVSIKNISESLSRAVDNSLHLLDKDKISLSLTGGADTRNLLAIFLSKGIKPHLYTYGNSNSDDCIKAKAIADGLGLSHSIHDIEMTADLFEEYARKIIRQSGGIASIHRAHRIIAVEREKQYADNMFLGTLGGEFIKGIDHDDYITSALLFENWSRSISKDRVMKAMEQKYLKISNSSLIESVYDFYLTLPYIKGSSTLRKHNALSHITAHLHDAQDINLYSNILNGQVITPFLNIDYLELIFSSNYTFDNKERIKNNYLKKINYPVYASNFIKTTYPPLLSYLYSGDHKPADVIFNKYYAALMKIFRKRKAKGKYQPNFPLGKWMEEFVERNLPLCNDHTVLKETFDLEGLMQALKKGNHQPKESYWLKFTNPIMMLFIFEEYTRS